MIATLLALAAGTFVSEDLTLLAAAGLIAEGTLDPWGGVFACAIGIFTGDLLLYALGRQFGPRVLRWKRVIRALPPAELATIRAGVNRRLAALIIVSRFVPGTRFALYVVCGALGISARSFALWCATAAAVWTPMLVLGTSLALLQVPISGWLRHILGLGLVVVVVRGIRRLSRDRIWRARLLATISLIWRWEFWPMWLFYAPVAAWLAVLIVRYRGVGPLRAANPGMPDGGIVGESKYAILRALPAQWTAPSLFVPPGAVADRINLFTSEMHAREWQLPLVFKPDVGQRGSGVKLLRTADDVRSYFEKEGGAVVVQPFHPGPYEAGVFYYRLPSWPRGRILSITDKRFPAVVGDGASTLEQLIWTDARLRMQARTFLSRHTARRHWIPAAGERVSLAMAGNHCQGTLFRDGRHLITPALEARLDTIAREYDGFFIGRFDIRYSDTERFKAGEDITIIELNGTTAESTNIYDPAGSLLSAYRQLFYQWHLVFAIGDANRALGSPTMSASQLLRLVRAHQSAPAAFAHSD